MEFLSSLNDWSSGIYVFSLNTLLDAKLSPNFISHHLGLLLKNRETGFWRTMLSFIITAFLSYCGCRGEGRSVSSSLWDVETGAGQSGKKLRLLWLREGFPATTVVPGTCPWAAQSRV